MREVSGNRLLQEAHIADAILLGEESSEVNGKTGIARENRLEPRGPIGGRQLEGFVQIRADGAPAISAERRHERVHAVRTRVANRMMQVEPALFPIPLDGPLRYAPQRGDFGERQPAEEFQVDDFGEVRFDLGELVERVADLNERVV